MQSDLARRSIAEDVESFQSGELLNHIAKAEGLLHTARGVKKTYYITTAIYYVNGEAHLGHAYETVISDVIARIHRALGEDVFFLTGLDEHGQKVQQAAIAEKMEPQEYCDKLAVTWRQLFETLGISHDDFVRTSDKRHKEVVQRILEKLQAEGHFYKEVYKGFYSTSGETFLTEKDRLPDGSFDPVYGKVVELEEENYYFKLKGQQLWLIDYIKKNPDFVQPSNRRNEVLGFLENNELEDLCISRPKARLSWGIPIPFDDRYVTYVWFDALVNYISIPSAHNDPTVAPVFPTTEPSSSSARPLWPADVHVIGKDILKFHAVYWPIMLKAMGLPLPRQVLVHGWWQKNGQKMSKSTGVVVDPAAVVAEWGLDAFRYYVVRELDIGPDGNWTDEGFAARYQAELANGLGNLVNRSISMLVRYRDGVVPAQSKELMEETEAAGNKARSQMEKHELQDALQTIWALITRANQYVDQTAPFKIAKDPAQSGRLDEVLYNLCEVCRIIAVLLYPFLPGTAERIYGQLGLTGAPDRLSALAWGGLSPGHKVGTPAPLFPRKDQKP